jgi:SnoaL-like polyketide cyclase
VNGVAFLFKKNKRRNPHGPTFKDFLAGGLPAATGRKMRFTGTTVLKVIDGRIAEEIGLDDGVAALTQLGLLRAA